MAKRRKRGLSVTLDDKQIGTGWSQIEALLTDPDLRAVDVSALAYAEFVPDLPRRDRRLFRRLPPEIPGRVMMFWFDRESENMRLLGVDEAGAAWVQWFVESGAVHEL